MSESKLLSGSVYVKGMEYTELNTLCLIIHFVTKRIQVIV